MRGRPGDRAHFAPPQARRRWSRWRIALTSISLVFVGVLLVAGIPFLLKARSAYDQIFNTPVPHPVVTRNADGTVVIDPDATEEAKLPDWDKKERVNVLLLGVDNAEEGDVGRSDTMILVTIDPATKQVGMMSIPRDLRVEIPNLGIDKINAAYSAGEMSGITGAAMARATVEYNFDIPIHYVAQVDFDGFTKIVDTLGGVMIDVAAPLKDDAYPAEDFNYTRVYFRTGLQHMDGQTALRYSRTRHDDSDFGRSVRQQQVLTALRQQAVGLNLLTKAPRLVQELGDTVRTDMSPTDVLALAKLGTEIKSENIRSFNLLEATTVEWEEGQPYYLVPDWDAVDRLLDEMMPGQVPLSETPPASTAPEGSQEPNLQAVITVQNATHVNRLASQAAEKLQTAGFIDVGAEQSPDTGDYPTSMIVIYGEDMVTARRIATILDLPESAIVTGNPANAAGRDILVILGDDAPRPTGG